MAEQRAQDVVNQSQSVGDLSPSDAPATTSTPDIKISGDDSDHVEVALALKENGIHTLSSLKLEDLDDADASVRSDTDTSRADGSVAGDKSTESKTLKKFVAKPVSFAKYSVPKVVAASAASKGSDKGMCMNAHVDDHNTADPLAPRNSHTEFLVLINCANRASATSRQNHQLTTNTNQALQNSLARSHASLEQEQRYDSLQ